MMMMIMLLVYFMNQLWYDMLTLLYLSIIVMPLTSYCTYAYGICVQSVDISRH